ADPAPRRAGRYRRPRLHDASKPAGSLVAGEVVKTRAVWFLTQPSPKKRRGRFCQSRTRHSEPRVLWALKDARRDERSLDQRSTSPFRGEFRGRSWDRTRAPCEPKTISRNR